LQNTNKGESKTSERNQELFIGRRGGNRKTAGVINGGTTNQHWIGKD